MPAKLCSRCEDTIPSKRAVEYDLCIFCAEELERQAKMYKPKQTRTIAPIIDDDSEYESPDDTLEFRKSDVELLLACDYSINRDFQKKEKEQ